LDDAIRACSQTTSKVIVAFVRALIGIGIPPISNGNFGEASWRGERLPDAIITAYITTQISTILPTMHIRVIYQIIAA
jgi:hypothetical protein